MGRVYDGIDDHLAVWIRQQPLLFVGTAPVGADGLVNVSPKGMQGTFRVIDPSTVAYLELTGSGIETVAHLRQNGRIVLMWCAFEGPPRILRVHGRGRALHPGDEGFDDLAAGFPALPGVRSIIVVDVTRVADSCGYAVPRMDLVGDRDRLTGGSQGKTPDELDEYRAAKNEMSVDGLPGLNARRSQ